MTTLYHDNCLRVMITSGGGPGVWGLLATLRTLPERIATVIVNDPSPGLTLGTGLADVGVRLPDAGQPAYAEALCEVCAANQVDVLIPVYDGELLKVLEVRDRLSAAGTQVLLPTAASVKTCSDKIATHQALAQTDFLPRFAVAETLADVEQAFEQLGAHANDLCVRPPAGTGSRGVHRITNHQPEFAERMCSRDGQSSCTPEEFLRWRAAGPGYFRC
jgi:carbamoyl-phosphate synthase large subunit